MSHQRSLSAVLSALLGLVAGPAFAVCVIDADIAATPGEDPSQPAWTYEVNLTWSNATGVDHWMLLLDTEFGTCSCADFQAALVLPEPAGGTRDNAEGVPGFLCERPRMRRRSAKQPDGLPDHVHADVRPRVPAGHNRIRSLYLPVGPASGPGRRGGCFPGRQPGSAKMRGYAHRRFPHNGLQPDRRGTAELGDVKGILSVGMEAVPKAYAGMGG
jgi:hypothetical protein